MGNVHKLPFILGATAAILIGLVGMNSGLDKKDIYIRMAISMVICFAIGVYIKNVIIGIKNEIEKKRIEEMQKEEEIRLQTERELKEHEDKNNSNNDAENKSKIDYRIDNDFGEDFSPLTINDYLKKNE